MKATDLMVGDSIYRPDCYDEVVEIRLNGIIGKDSNRGLIPFDEIRPIEITPEILEKIGFIDASGKKLKYEYESFNKDVQLNYLTKYSVFSIYIKNEKDNYLWGLIRPNEWYKALEGEINYIHELQHALRLCGIDKEIIL